MDNSTNTISNSTRTSAKETEAENEYLTFILGTEEYCLKILKVQEIRSYDAVRKITNTPDFIKGVINLRDIPSLVTSIDTKYIIGLATVETRMLILVDIEQLMSKQEIALFDNVVH